MSKRHPQAPASDVQLFEELLKGKHAEIEPRAGLRREVLAEIDVLRGTRPSLLSVVVKSFRENSWTWASAAFSLFILTSLTVRYNFFLPPVPLPQRRNLPPALLDGIDPVPVEEALPPTLLMDDSSSSESSASSVASSESFIPSPEPPPSLWFPFRPEMHSSSVRSSARSSSVAAQRSLAAGVASSSSSAEGFYFQLPWTNAVSSSSRASSVWNPPLPSPARAASSSVAPAAAQSSSAVSAAPVFPSPSPSMSAGNEPSASFGVPMDSFGGSKGTSSVSSADIHLLLSWLPDFSVGVESAVELLLSNEGTEPVTVSLPFSWGDGTDGILPDILLEAGERRAISLPHAFVESGSYTFSASVTLGGSSIEAGDVNASLWVSP